MTDLSWRQAIIWVNASILLIEPNFQWKFNKNTDVFKQQKEFENIVYQMVDILFRPQYVKQTAREGRRPVCFSAGLSSWRVRLFGGFVFSQR